MNPWLHLGAFIILYLWLAWRRLDIAIALLLFLLPAYQFRFTLFIPSTYLEVMIVICLAVWAVQITVRHQWRETRWPWRWLICAFAVAGAVAVAVSPNIRNALGLYKAYVIEPVLFFIVVVNVMKTPAHWKKIFFALGSSVVIIGLAALFQQADILPGAGSYLLEHPPRSTSLFEFPTAVGKYVAPILAVFLSLLLVKTKSVGRGMWHSGNVMYIGVIGFGIMALMLSVSRGALIGVGAALVFVSFFSRWRKWLLIGIASIAVLCLVIPVTRHELVSIVNIQDTSADVHVVMWKGTLRMIADRPIFGAGLAGFPELYEQYKEASHVEFFPNPDHLFLTLWVEMGLLGLAVFLWIIVKWLRTGVFVVKSQYAEYRPYAVGVMAALVAVITHGFFDTPYFKNDLAVMFWALAAVLVAMRFSVEPPRSKEIE
ncbi:MAG: O-antigen ligase family protein [Patescibacteria group bacterium]|jgi:putative inorganic carbon (HCO3(-)) transporter